MIYHTTIKKRHDFCQVFAAFRMTEVLLEYDGKKDFVVSFTRGVIHFLQVRCKFLKQICHERNIGTHGLIR